MLLSLKSVVLLLIICLIMFVQDFQDYLNSIIDIFTPNVKVFWKLFDQMNASLLNKRIKVSNIKCIFYFTSEMTSLFLWSHQTPLLLFFTFTFVLESHCRMLNLNFLCANLKYLIHFYCRQVTKDWPIRIKWKKNYTEKLNYKLRLMTSF